MSNFELNKSFALRQMRISIQLIFPSSLVHSIMYVFQFGSYIIYANNFDNFSVEGAMLTSELVNFARVIANFVLMAFLWLQNKKRSRQTGDLFANRQNETDVYFQHFRQAIS
jgi:hypothetical protein